jgi:putative transcriptional regulator
MSKTFAHLILGFCLAQLLAGLPLAGAAISPPVISSGPQQKGPEPAAGKFLVARRSFLSPFFRRTVVYLLQHNAEASFGVIVNQPSRQRLSEVVEGERNTRLEDLPVYYGGPVERQALTIVLRTPRPPFLTEPVTGDIYYSVYPQLLHDPSLQSAPAASLRCYTGYASWSPGQLEEELKKGYWQLMEAEPAMIFGDGAEDLWETLIQRVEQ